MSLIQRTARKTHSCDECPKPIPAGSKYMDGRDAKRPGVAFRYHLKCVPRAPEEDDEFDEALAAAEAGWDGHKVWFG